MNNINEDALHIKWSEMSLDELYAENDLLARKISRCSRNNHSIAELLDAIQKHLNAYLMFRLSEHD